MSGPPPYARCGVSVQTVPAVTFGVGVRSDWVVRGAAKAEAEAKAVASTESVAKRFIRNSCGGRILQ